MKRRTVSIAKSSCAWKSNDSDSGLVVEHISDIVCHICSPYGEEVEKRLKPDYSKSPKANPAAQAFQKA
jgi:hypothetical protein